MGISDQMDGSNPAIFWARYYDPLRGIVTCGCTHFDEVLAASCAARLEDEDGSPAAEVRRIDARGIFVRRWNGSVWVWNELTGVALDVALEELEGLIAAGRRS